MPLWRVHEAGDFVTKRGRQDAVDKQGGATKVSAIRTKDYHTLAVNECRIVNEGRFDG